MAERALGVSGTADDPWISPRRPPFPLPPFPLSYSGGLFAQACRGLGIAMSHLPQARNSIAYGGRSQCLACGTWHVCPTGAKASVDLTQIPRAEATGYAQVLADMTALRLEVDPSGRVAGVVCTGRDRQERRLSATVFVVAAGAIETARLLLLSVSPEFPQGLANRSGTVGKYFLSHPSVDVTGRMKDKVYPYRTGFSTAMSRQFAVDRDRSRRGAFLFEFLNSAGPMPAALAQASGRWGAALRQHVRQEFGRTLGIRIFCEQLPDLANAISLNRQVRDPFGNPVPHITYNVGAYERRTLEEAKGVAERILRAMGATDIQSTDLNLAAHQIGVHRMGTNARASVVDVSLRAHDVRNLYLVGGGCFVTASSSPPILTIVALAIRAAEHIAALLRQRQRAAKTASP